MEENCKSNVSYLDLRKELNLTLKQFKTKLNCIGLDFKESYTENEVQQLKKFIALNLNKNELRELPYTKKGWIPIRVMPSELQCSKNTILSYIEKLNLNIYKPIHQLSFISQEDFNKLKDFVFQFNSTNERKLYLEKQTCIKRYKVDNPSQTKNAREKISIISKENAKDRLEKAKQTCLEKYGVENPFEKWDSKKYWDTLSPEEKEIRNQKIRDSKLAYRKDKEHIYLYQLTKMFNVIDSSGVERNLQKLGICKYVDFHPCIDKKDLPILKDFYKTTSMNGVSYLEKEVYKFIKSIYEGEVKENVRDIIPPKELDIYIPDKKIAIEFNGLYWHSELFLNDRYHLEKTLTCEKQNIQLIHIFEDDWLYRQDIIKSMIATRLGIYEKRYMARKLKIKEITKQMAEKFFNKNHLQGFAKGNIYLALVDDTLDIIQCTIINRKGFHDGNPELTRMATKLNCQVVGGFSKLLKHIMMDYHLETLVSYINRAWFNGNGYFSCGFKTVKENPPSYFYIYNNERIHKSKFRRDKIKSLFNIGKLNYWNENESEHENMLKNHLYRIYDCGTIKVQLNREYL